MPSRLEIGRSVRQLLDPLHRVRHELAYWQSRTSGAIAQRLSTYRKRRLFAEWLRTLRNNPPDVLAGANIDRSGGIRQHLLGIQSHSALKVSLAPPDVLTDELTYHDFRSVLLAQFNDFDPRGVRAIHSHVYPYFIKWCASKAVEGFRWIHTYHSFYLAAAEGGYLLPWQEEINETLVRVARNADVRISVSRWLQRYMESNFGIQCTYVPNGVDVNFCDSADPERFGRNYATSPFVLYVGRDEPVKNPADFVSLAARLPKLRFIMIGSGLDATSRSAWVSHLPGNVLLLGQQSRLSVQDAIAACSAIVVTSALEGLPTVVLEAMAHGKPIVVPNVPGCMEPVKDRLFGFIYRHDDVEDLVEKTKQALSGNAYYSSAREIVLAEYDWRIVARHLDAIYAGEQQS
jgi:glycosyltransferase involved in cell wall biosynthesis